VGTALGRQELGVGIAGMGYAGGEHLRAFHEHPDAFVAAVCDIDRDQAERRLAEFALDCPVYASFEELVQDPRVSAVVIATPNRFHAEQAIRAAQAGTSILLEKPPALTPSEFEAIMSATAAAGVVCEVDFVLRWHPMCAAVADLVRSGQLGEVFLVEADLIIGELEPPEPEWSRTQAFGGNLFLTIGCHALDQVIRMADSVPVSVYASTVGRSPDWEFDSTLVTIVNFANGSIGRVTSSVEAKLGYELNLRVLGTRGSVVNNVATLSVDGVWQQVTLSEETPDQDALPFGITADKFLKTVADARASAASLADVEECFRVVFAAGRSAAEGIVVPLAGSEAAG
jgi:predicted dehydrogenase